MHINKGLNIPSTESFINSTRKKIHQNDTISSVALFNTCLISRACYILMGYTHTCWLIAWSGGFFIAMAIPGKDVISSSPLSFRNVWAYIWESSRATAPLPFVYYPEPDIWEMRPPFKERTYICICPGRAINSKRTLIMSVNSISYGSWKINITERDGAERKGGEEKKKTTKNQNGSVRCWGWHQRGLYSELD